MRPVTAARSADPAIAAVTFDFGNTLVPVGNAALREVVARTAEKLAATSGPFAPADFVSIWHEERERQFAEEVPAGREVDIEQRIVRVLARLRGRAAPSPEARWNDAAAAALSTPDERATAVDIYSAAFVDAVHSPPEVGPILSRLAGRWSLAVLSNWPLAATVDRFLEAAGWRDLFKAVVISQRVGAIKPASAMFEACQQELAVPGDRILHVGDDWLADVVGAKRAGWQAAYLRGRQADSPLPSSRPDESVAADIVIDELAELESAVDGLDGIGAGQVRMAAADR